MRAVSPLRHVALDDKYLVTSSPVFITAIQALVRLPLLRRELDLAQGVRTAGYISGYRGSPLGGYDRELAKAKALLQAQDIVVQPAVNEDLGVTAVWGTQQVGLYPGAKHGGVFGLWYGKGPGVGRSGDAFKQANFAGTTPNGGVLAFAGDDHACKSSTLPNQSDFAFIDAEMASRACSRG
jgi:indolepyruvate ferredoxin oxidoreductase